MKQENIDTHYKRNLITSEIQLNQFYDSTSNWKMFLDSTTNTLFYRHTTSKQISRTPPDGVFKKLGLTDYIQKDMVDIYEEARKKYQGNVKSQMTKVTKVDVTICGFGEDVRKAMHELQNQLEVPFQRNFTE